jgi:hypothetical protein
MAIGSASARAGAAAGGLVSEEIMHSVRMQGALVPQI